MDFVPDGWLRSFSDAAELYDKLRFDERPTSGGEPEARMLTLKKKQGDGQRLTDDEQKELTQLEDEYWLMQMLQFFGVTFGEQHRENKGKLIHDARRWRQADSTKRLQQRLFDQDVRASIQDRNTGELHPLPGRFWASEQAEAMINGKKGLGRAGLALHRSVDYSVRIDAFRTALGPVRICREDVIRAARPATDPPANLTVDREPFTPAAMADPLSGESSEPAVQYPSAADWFRKVGKTAAENGIRTRGETITSGKVKSEAAVLWNNMPGANKAPGARPKITKEAFKHAEKRAPKKRGRGGTV